MKAEWKCDLFVLMRIIICLLSIRIATCTPHKRAFLFDCIGMCDGVQYRETVSHVFFLLFSLFIYCINNEFLSPYFRINYIKMEHHFFFVADFTLDTHKIVSTVDVANVQQLIRSRILASNVCLTYAPIFFATPSSKQNCVLATCFLIHLITELVHINYPYRWQMPIIHWENKNYEYERAIEMLLLIRRPMEWNSVWRTAKHLVCCTEAVTRFLLSFFCYRSKYLWKAGDRCIPLQRMYGNYLR